MALHFTALSAAAFAADFYNLPICRAGGDQSAPVIIAGGSDGAFILWLDGRTAQRKIFCQRLNQLGQPQWQTNGLEIAKTSGRHERFSALADGSGGLFIVWQEAAGSDDGDIYAQRLDHNGVRLWGEGGKEVYRGSREQTIPMIVAEGSGGAIVIWQDERGGTWDLFAQRMNANGDKLWNPAGVALIAESHSQLLGDAIAIPGQGFGVAWRDERTTPGRVLVQRFDFNGNKIWNDATWVAQSLTDQSQPKLSVDAGAAGFVYVAWIDRRLNIPNVYAQRLSANGALQWGLFGLAAANTLDEQKEVQLLADQTGGVFLVWEDARADKGDIYAQHLNREGRQLWPSAGLALMQAEQGQYRPRAAHDDAGGLFCTWEDDRGSGTTTAAQRVDATGNLLWPADGVMLTNHGDKTFEPVILSRANGQAFVAWSDTRNPNDDIYAQALAADGQFENVPPVITSLAPTVAYINTEYNYAVASRDFDSGDTLELALTTAPAWLQLDQTTKALRGIPGANDGGEFQVEIQASDAGGGRGVQNFVLQVLPDPASPQITSQPDTITNEDATYRYQLLVSDPDPQEALQYKLETAAAWLSLSAPGVLSGIPLNEHVGVYAVKITATNRKGKADQQQFNLTVLNTNDPPQIVSAPPPRANEGAAYSYKLEAVDIDRNDSLTFIATRKPAWLQLSARGNLSGTPVRSDPADTVLAVYVRDIAGARDQKNYAIPLDLGNTPPRLTSSPPLAVKEDSLYRYLIVAVDPDPNEVLKLVLLQAPAWLQLDTLARVLSGTPRNAHVGEHAILLEVRDRMDARAQQRFTVRVENTNDAPVFTGAADTVAFVDSLYEYTAAAQDVDAGDRVTLTVTQAPAWLVWDVASKTLRGTPRLPDVGNVTVILRAQDLSQAITTQQFSLHVYNLGAPDATAPLSPQNIVMAPATWSRSANFTVRWQNPFDPSGITGAFYKIGAPPDSNRDGTKTAPAPGQTLQEIKLQALRSGKIPVYVWLVDGSGNLDYKTAARVDYRYDTSAPQPASQLRAGNALAWANGDTIRFAWQAASDSLSGVARQDLIIAGKTIRRFPGAAAAFALDTLLTEKKFDWHITAVDSAGNVAPSLTASFRVDRTPPLITHAPADTAEAGQPFNLRATARDPLAGIANVRVLHRAAGLSDFSETIMSAAGGEFIAAIAGTAIQSPGLQYVILATDSAGNVGRSTGNANALAVHAAVVKSKQIFARSATRGEYYQLVSIPYRLARPSPGDIFADNFGAYDPLRWRLYAYAPQAGNIEFGKPEFQQIEPGRAYWLITAQPQNFDAGAAVSVSTKQAFTFELQPGWNLIATPFDFPTDWTAVQKPPLVESQLWAFDGRQYLANGNTMQPWQGYFVRNLSEQPQTLVIPPPCADCVNDLLLTPVHAEVSLQHVGGDSAEEIPAYTGMTSERLLTNTQEPYVWKLQLNLRSEEFADTQNWLGVSALAQEEWDRLELSEPPPAAGEFMTLRFPQRHWKKFSGEFTTDFRPPAASVQKWVFEIYATQSGKALSLDFHRTGAIPENWSMLLQNENEQWLRQIDFDENGCSQTIALRSGAAPRRFILWTGAQEELNKTGLLAATLPQAFALAPSYPNPARMPAQSQAVSTMRFSLPVEAEVDLAIWDVLGRPVRTLLQKARFNAGHHEILWNGRDDAGQAVAAGVYFCRIQTERFNAMQKIILLH